MAPSPLPTRLDMEFEGAGESEGLLIWRIEKMKLRSVLPSEYGTFYEGDSYLVLKTYGSPGRSWNVHIWIGKDSSPDEQCVCAYKSLELEEVLKRRAVQYRETQNHESKQFLSYFKLGVRYMVGGVSSGLRKVSSRLQEKRLFKVKGKVNCRVKQVPVAVDSLNKDDSFILLAESKIFVWNGPKCNPGERIKAAEVARCFRDERPGKLQIVLIDEEWNSHHEFFKNLGAEPGLFIAESAEDDVEFERSHDEGIKLFRVSDVTGAIAVEEVPPPLTKQSLDTNDCFFLDFGTNLIYVWVGKECTEQERTSVWLQAKGYLLQRELPVHTPIVKVNEGFEPALMKIALNWLPDRPTKNDSIEGIGIAKIDPEAHRVDIHSLHEPMAVQPTKMIDDGTGFVKVWRVQNFTLTEVPYDDYGIFYSGDSYVVHYRGAHIFYGIVYFWLGMLSSVDEQAAAAMFSTQVNEHECCGHAVQVRVTQSKEPDHFLAIFDGFVCTLLGGAESGFKAQRGTAKTNSDASGTRLFQIRNNRVAQVVPKAASLNSGDVFIVDCASGSCYLWIGQGSTERESQIAQKCVRRLKLRSSKEVAEGTEPADFWEALGGEAAYATGGNLNVCLQHTARLFHCSNARGYFHVEEICDFSQCDLEPNDVMLMDTFREIFVWVGDGSNVTEQKEALNLAIEYISQDPYGRTLDDTVMLTVKQGFEPYTFTAHFPSWDPNYWKNALSYEEIKQSLGSENVETVQQAIEQFHRTYPVDILRRTASELPAGVDPSHKEEHLSKEDFVEVFGYTHDEFKEMKPWKRLDEKRRVGLF